MRVCVSIPDVAVFSQQNIQSYTHKKWNKINEIIVWEECNDSRG